MNTNDLPPAARLAALIEVGIASHPDVRHAYGTLAEPVFDRTETGYVVRRIERGCALCYAALGAGASQCEVGEGQYNAVYERLSSFPRALLDKVERANFNQGINATIRSLREGALAKVAV